jgi:hypothetical protein
MFSRGLSAACKPDPAAGYARVGLAGKHARTAHVNLLGLGGMYGEVAVGTVRVNGCKAFELYGEGAGRDCRSRCF